MDMTINSVYMTTRPVSYHFKNTRTIATTPISRANSAHEIEHHINLVFITEVIWYLQNIFSYFLSFDTTIGLLGKKMFYRQNSVYNKLLILSFS